MLQEALQKIQKEIGENPKDRSLAYIGSELIKFLRNNPDKAYLFADESKSLKGSYEAIWKEALKTRTNGLSSDEGMEIVMKYYGIEPQPVAPAPRPVGFSANLKDLLG